MVVNGVEPFSPNQGIAALEFAIQSKKPKLLIADVDIGTLGTHFSLLAKYFSNVKTKRIATQSRCKLSVSSVEFWQQFDEGGLPIMQKYISQGVKSLLKFEEQEQVDIHKSFQDMGIDSLMVVELKNILQGIFGDRISLSTDIINDFNTISLLAEWLFKIALC